MKKIIAFASLLLAGSTLAACASDTLDGEYTGTATNEGITFQIDLTVNGDTCQFITTAPILGEVPSECSIDQDAKTITLDGEEGGYTVDGDTVTIGAMNTDEDIVLKKIK